MTEGYSSRYALARGKIQVISGTENGPYLWTGQTNQVWGRDVHRTHTEAVMAAEAARDRKILSLKKQIAKLEKMDFSL